MIYKIMELYMYIQWKDILKFYSNLGMLGWWIKVFRTMGEYLNLAAHVGGHFSMEHQYT